MKAGDGNFAVLPSDHIVEVNEECIKAFRIAEKFSDRFLVTFGIRPTKAHSGYGYIKPGNDLGGAFRVEDFHEKPDLRMAEAHKGGLPMEQRHVSF